MFWRARLTLRGDPEILAVDARVLDPLTDLVLVLVDPGAVCRPGISRENRPSRDNRVARTDQCACVNRVVSPS